MGRAGYKYGLLLVLVVLIGWSLVALQGAPPGARAQEQDHLLKGVIDFHCHSGPDVIGRLINDFEVVRQAKAAGMRAIVLKNHYTMTADRAQLAMQEIGGVQVYGGITLNLSVGGLNAEAVRKMVQMDGQRGRMVWLPTYDGEAQVRQGVGTLDGEVGVIKDAARTQRAGGAGIADRKCARHKDGRTIGIVGEKGQRARTRCGERSTGANETLGVREGLAVGVDGDRVVRRGQKSRVADGVGAGVP